MITSLILAVEGNLDEYIVRQLLLHVDSPYQVGVVLGRRGWPYLKHKAPGLNKSSATIPVALFADLDHHECPIALMDDWLPNGKNPAFVLRIAVREVEAWLLADGGNLADFLGVSRDLMPTNVESLMDPKQSLVNLARHAANRKLRDDIVPRGTRAGEGPNYTGRLQEFVRDFWDINQAALASPSLASAVAALRRMHAPI